MPVPDAKVRKMAGHAKVTTARYDWRGGFTKQKVALLLHIPFEI